MLQKRAKKPQRSSQQDIERGNDSSLEQQQGLLQQERAVRTSPPRSPRGRMRSNISGDNASRAHFINKCLVAISVISTLISVQLAILLLQRSGSGADISLQRLASSGTPEETKKPLFIIHVGPAKSSTTTLQAIFTKYRTTLEEDNYLYVGRVYDDEGNYEGYHNENFRNLVSPKCLDRGDLVQIYNNRSKDNDSGWSHNPNAPACWKNFLVELERVRRTGMNVLVSDEMMSIRAYKGPKLQNQLFQDALENWDVRIVATYRRFFAWLPSHKNHHDKFRLDISSKWDYTNWRGSPTKHMYSQLQEYMADPRGTLKYPYIDEIVRYYSEFFPVEVMNMHDPDYPTLAAQFACKFLPNAHRTCENLMQDRGSSSLKLNTAKSGVYDILAMDAHNSGVVNKYAGTRVYVREEIQTQQEDELGKGPLDFPLQCPTREEVQKLLDMSLRYEETYFPEFYRSSIGETAHRKEFWEMYDKKKLCSIDTAKIMQDKVWKKFFQELNEEGERDAKKKKKESRDGKKKKEDYGEILN